MSNVNRQNRKLLVSILLPKLSGGGISRTRTTLARGLLRSGCADVEFILEKDGGALQGLVPDDASVHVVGRQRFRGMASVLADYLKTRRPHVLLASKELHSFAALLARRKSGAPTAIFPTLHGNFAMRLTHNRSGFEAAWLPRAVRFSYMRANRVVCVSEGASEGLIASTGLPREKVVTIHNPFDLDAIRHEAASDQVSHPWLSQGRDVPCLLAAGRLAEEKDYVTLLRAMQRIVTQRKIRLVILGEGPKRRELETLITELGLQEHVAMPGFVHNPFPDIAACDQFVLSSKWEGLPGVLVQALALGRNVVSTDCPHGPREILKNGEIGGLVPLGDHAALASTIIAGLDSPKRPETLAIRAADFEMMRIVDKYLALFSEEGAWCSDWRANA